MPLKAEEQNLPTSDLLISNIEKSSSNIKMSTSTTTSLETTPCSLPNVNGLNHTSGIIETDENSAHSISKQSSKQSRDETDDSPLNSPPPSKRIKSASTPTMATMATTPVAAPASSFFTHNKELDSSSTINSLPVPAKDDPSLVAFEEGSEQPQYNELRQVGRNLDLELTTKACTPTDQLSDHSPATRANEISTMQQEKDKGNNQDLMEEEEPVVPSTTKATTESSPNVTETLVSTVKDSKLDEISMMETDGCVDESQVTNPIYENGGDVQMEDHSSIALMVTNQIVTRVSTNLDSPPY